MSSAIAVRPMKQPMAFVQSTRSETVTVLFVDMKNLLRPVPMEDITPNGPAVTGMNIATTAMS